jgi:hypothetical protein
MIFPIRVFVLVYFFIFCMCISLYFCTCQVCPEFLPIRVKLLALLPHRLFPDIESGNFGLTYFYLKEWVDPH